MNNVRRIKIINISQDGGSQLKLRYYYPVATSSISVCVSKVNNTLFNFNGVTLLLFFVAKIHSLYFFHFHFVLNKVAIVVKVTWWRHTYFFTYKQPRIQKAEKLPEAFSHRSGRGRGDGTLRRWSAQCSIDPESGSGCSGRLRVRDRANVEDLAHGTETWWCRLGPTTCTPT